MKIKQYMDEIRREQLNRLNSTPQMPSIGQMGKNLLQTAVDTAKNVMQGESVSITEEQAAARLAICNQCEFYKETRCTKCGCYMAVKTHLRAANCPINKW